jgi:hypothetical protein
MSNAEIIKFLNAGNRLEKPGICPDDLYQVMLQCWDRDPQNRPSFTVRCSSRDIQLMVCVGDQSSNTYQALQE